MSSSPKMVTTWCWTIGLASADRATINVFVNDDSNPFTTVHPKIQGGNTLLRQSDHAKYDLEYVPIPTSLLKSGENVIGLTQTSVRNNQSHVMYDYLNLELP